MLANQKTTIAVNCNEMLCAVLSLVCANLVVLTQIFAEPALIRHKVFHLHGRDDYFAFNSSYYFAPCVSVLFA